MSNKNKILLSVLVSIVLLAFIFWPKLKNEKEASITPLDEGEGGDNNSILNNLKNIYDTSVFPLKKGSSGQYVIWLQKSLNLYAEKVRKIKPPLVADGKFGNQTEFWLNEIFKVKQVSQALYNQIADTMTKAMNSTFTGFLN